MNKKILLLRTSYWAGAIIDALATIPLVFPSIHAWMYGISYFSVTPVINNFSYTAASLMLGWTIILIWADRKPIERKGVLPITIFPVVAGIAYSGIYLVMTGIVEVQRIIPTIVMQVCITILFLFSYIYASLKETGS